MTSHGKKGPFAEIEIESFFLLNRSGNHVWFVSICCSYPHTKVPYNTHTHTHISIISTQILSLFASLSFFLSLPLSLSIYIYIIYIILIKAYLRIVNEKSTNVTFTLVLFYFIVEKYISKHIYIHAYNVYIIYLIHILHSHTHTHTHTHTRTHTHIYIHIYMSNFAFL